MPDPVRVSVTQDDIDHGIRGNCRHCPVARAVERVFPTSQLVTVGSIQIRVLAADGDRWYDVPSRVANFIRKFDSGRPVYPFTFTMTPDPEYA